MSRKIVFRKGAIHKKQILHISIVSTEVSLVPVTGVRMAPHVDDLH